MHRGEKDVLNPALDILVVDDIDDARLMLCIFLRQLGMKKLREAEDGKSALEELRYHKADLVI